jgi:two-component system KDP operon response regulator KdpE
MLAKCAKCGTILEERVHASNPTINRYRNRALTNEDKSRLLIIDDDQGLLRALELYLGGHGYQIVEAEKGSAGLRKLYNSRPDLVCLDVMLPDIDGWQVLKRIREMTDVPVIMLTARGDEGDRVKGLKLGADDYVPKPFSMRELEARVEAVLRRSRSSNSDEAGKATYSDGYLTIDTERAEVRCNGDIINLTPTEQKLLFYLVQNCGRLLSFEQILQRVWGFEYRDEKEYVRLYVWRLRQKIEPKPEEPRYILTEHGMGYRFAG